MSFDKKPEKAVIVFLSSESRGLAVEVTFSEPDNLVLPQMIAFFAHGIYDATNDRVLKWKLDKSIDELRPTLQLMAANPRGRFLRGTTKVSRSIDDALSSDSPAPPVWVRVAVIDTFNGIVLPDYASMLSGFSFHPEDAPLIAPFLNRVEE